MAKGLPEPISGYEVVKRFIKSIDKGLLKVMSKMGISTYQSYCGAQIFDAVGLARAFVDEFFFGTATTIEGAGLAEIAAETERRHADAFGDSPVLRTALEVGGEYAYRVRGEAHNWTPQTVVAAAARRARQRPRPLRRLRQGAQRAERASAHHPRPLPHQGGRRGRPNARSARRGRTRGENRQALRDRRDVFRLDFARGAYHARHRDEPHRRQVQYGRRRRGVGPLQADGQRQFDAQRDQAGRLGPLRRDDGISRQLRHDADQDGAGRKARRRRTVARPQGRRGHRQGAAFDAGRRPHFAAAASRHLFDRGSEAARLRPEERQSRSAGLGQARCGGRRRHRRGGRRQMQGGPCHHLRL